MASSSAGAQVAGSLPIPARAASPFHADIRWRWITISPALALMLALSVLPLANLLAISFFEITWSGGKAVWNPVGLRNYRALPSDGLLHAGVANTAIFAVVAVTAQMVLGFLLALLCTKVTRGRIFYRTIFILPVLIPGIVIGAIWKLMYNFDFGLINQLAGLAGMQPRDWLGAYGTALASVIVVDIWHWTPFCFLLMLAGLESLPQDVYEAAKIDGATGFQELIWITLPMMAPAIFVTLVFRLVLAFKVFDEVYLLTGGGPGTATEVISFTIYQRFFTEDRVGYGSALSVAVILLVSLLLVLLFSARRRQGAAVA
jgi:multiple sugar transport system permease protein